MDCDPLLRSRTAYWRAFREADSIRLRQWERSQVTLPQLRVLYHLRRHPETTTGALARALGITVSTTSGLVIKLVDRGLVARGSVADDRRQAPLRLSDAGAALLGELLEDTRLFLGEVADRLGDDLERVTWALERLAEVAQYPFDQPTSACAQAGDVPNRPTADQPAGSDDPGRAGRRR